MAAPETPPPVPETPQPVPPPPEVPHRPPSEILSELEAAESSPDYLSAFATLPGSEKPVRFMLAKMKATQLMNGIIVKYTQDYERTKGIMKLVEELTSGPNSNGLATLVRADLYNGVYTTTVRTDRPCGELRSIETGRVVLSADEMAAAVEAHAEQCRAKEAEKRSKDLAIGLDDAYVRILLCAQRTGPIAAAEAEAAVFKAARLVVDGPSPGAVRALIAAAIDVCRAIPRA